MARMWKTHRGDEWWWEEGAVRAEASTGPGFISIDLVERHGGSLRSADLYRVLCNASEDFDGAGVVLDIGASGVRESLGILESTGLVKTKAIDSPYSKQVRVLSVKPVDE